MKRYIKAASYKEIQIPEMTVTEFLNNFDFDYEVRYSEEFDEPCWKLVDLQGGNLGNIEEYEFDDVEGILDSLEIYYDDYLLDEDESNADYADYADYADLLDRVVKSDPNDWRIPYIYYVLHPDELIVDKPLQ